MAYSIASIYRHLRTFEAHPGQIEHLWFYTATQTLPQYNIWFDSVAWAKLILHRRTVAVLYLAINLLRWMALGHHVIMDWSNQSPGQRCNSLALLCGGVMAVGWTAHMWVMRDQISSLVRDVEALCVNLPRNTGRVRQWWAETREFYPLEGRLFFYCSLVAPFCWCLIIMVVMLYTGVMLCPTADMRDVATYSVHWWCQYVFQSFCAIYSVMLFSVQQFIYLELTFVIGRLHRLHADSVKLLYTGSEIDQGSEYKKLKNCVKITLELRGITDRFNEYMRFSVFSIGYLSLFSIVVGIIATLLQIKHDGTTGLVVVMGYCLPVYFLVTAFLWTMMGELYIDQTQTLTEAWYLCNWAGAPVPARKLIYMTMLMLNEPVRLDFKPFLVLNRDLLANILKTVYYLLNILKEQLL